MTDQRLQCRLSAQASQRQDMKGLKRVATASLLASSSFCRFVMPFTIKLRVESLYLVKSSLSVLALRGIQFQCRF